MVKKEQEEIVCEGCGSKWKIKVTKGRIEAKLLQCPICFNEE